uniref:Uncharacterized protein n=1 Tax=Zea mays TaxID=4577 RepID=C4J3A6_MAIZE|nr:unknown [Zea mays]
MESQANYWIHIAVYIIDASQMFDQRR